MRIFYLPEVTIKNMFSVTENQIGGFHSVSQTRKHLQKFWKYFRERNIWKNVLSSEAATRGVLCKNVFLEISQSLQENTCARKSCLIKLQPEHLFTEHLWTTAPAKIYDEDFSQKK